MANKRAGISPDLYNWLTRHPFKRLENKTLQSLLSGATLHGRIEYKAVMKEICHDIYEFVKQKHSGYLAIFALIKPKAKSNTGEILDVAGYIEDGKSIELLNPRTLETCVTQKAGAPITLNILRAFQYVHNPNLQKANAQNTISGKYNLFNLHGIGKEQFQLSNLHIDIEGESRLDYFSRRNKLESNSVELEVIGTDKLLISFRMDNCLMMFYAYMGANSSPQLLIPAFFYNDSNGYTVTSLAVLEKVSDEELRTPKRDQKSTGDPDIDRFLKHKAPLLSAKVVNLDGMQFNRQDLNLEPQNLQAYNQLKHLKGLYSIYYCEHNSTHPDYIKNSFFSTVGRGLIRIFEDTEKVLRCEMKTPNHSDRRLIHYSGQISNHLLPSSPFAAITLVLEESQDRSVNLHILNTKHKWMFGSYNAMYLSSTETGSGVIVLHRMLDEQDHSEEAIKSEFKAQQPSSLLPNFEYEGLSFTERSVLNYLSRIKGTRANPITQREALDKDNIYQGVYKMYSYSNSGIRIDMLRIHATGFVEHISVGRSEKETVCAYGEARQVRQSLYIQLENTDNGRLGFCVFKTEGELAPVKERIFTGTFCGVTRRNGEFPIASRLVLEFIGRDSTQEGLEPAYIKYDDPGHKAIDPALRQIFKGRSESMIGFLKDKSNFLTMKELEKFSKSELDRGAAFLSAAVYERVHGEGEDLAKQLLHRALKYGELEAEEAYQKKLQEQASILLERAAYQLLAKNDEQAALSLLKKANKISFSALDLSTFKQDVAGAPALQRLAELPGYRELSGE